MVTKPAQAGLTLGLVLLLAAVAYRGTVSPVSLRSVSSGEAEAERSARSWAAKAFSGLHRGGGGGGEKRPVFGAAVRAQADTPRHSSDRVSRFESSGRAARHHRGRSEQRASSPPALPVASGGFFSAAMASLGAAPTMAQMEASSARRTRSTFASDAESELPPAPRLGARDSRRERRETNRHAQRHEVGCVPCP